MYKWQQFGGASAVSHIFLSTLLVRQRTAQQTSIL